MDRISQVNQVLLLIRKQLAARTDKRHSHKAASQRPDRAPPNQSLEGVIANRLDRLQTAGLANRSTLARILLEEILTAQFGREILNDANFQKTIGDVQSAIEEDPELGPLLSNLLEG
jgi:hypothetical protein